MKIVEKPGTEGMGSVYRVEDNKIHEDVALKLIKPEIASDKKTVACTFLKNRKLIDLSVSQVQPIIKGQDLFTLPIEITIVTSKGERKETIWVKNKSDQFLLHCDEEPLMVSFDGSGALVSEVHFDKSLDELCRIWQV